MSGTYSSGASQTIYDREWEKQNNLPNEIKCDLIFIRRNETIEGRGSEDFFLILSPRSVTTAHAPLTSSSITRNWQREKLSSITRKLEDQFFLLRQRQDNWDYRGSKKPSKLSLSYAEGIIRDLLIVIIEAGFLWLTPSISSDEDGNITIEWHKGKHELHIEVREDEAEYIKVWGINIENEMHLDFLDRQNYIALWTWLLHG